jgi:hypothetical protein
MFFEEDWVKVYDGVFLLKALFHVGHQHLYSDSRRTRSGYHGRIPMFHWTPLQTHLNPDADLELELWIEVVSFTCLFQHLVNEENKIQMQLMIVQRLFE